MIRYLFFLLLLFPVPLHAQHDISASAAEAPLGPRLGSDIDRAERTYFNLFPDVDDFRTARLSWEGNSLRIDIVTDGGNDPSLLLSERDAAFLRWYLQNFEAIAHRDEGSASSAMIALAEDKTLLRSLESLLDRNVFEPVSRRSMGDASKACIVLQDSTVVEGTVLWNDTAGVALWTGEIPFSVGKLSDHVRILSMDEMAALTTDVSIGFHRSFAWFGGIFMALTYKLFGELSIDNLKHEDVIEIATFTFLGSLLTALPASAFAKWGEDVPVQRTLLPGMKVEDRNDLLDRLRPHWLFDEGLPMELRYAVRDFRLAHEGTPPSLPVAPPRIEAPSTAGAWLGGEAATSLFGARTQAYGVGLGVTASYNLALLRFGTTDWRLGLRPRFAAGWTYVSAEAVATLQLDGPFYLSGGLTWLWTDDPDESATGRAGGGHSERYVHHVSVDRSSFWKQTSVTVGLGYLFEDSSIELQYRRLTEPVLSATTTVYPSAFSYPNTTPYTEDLGSWAYSTVSIIYSWRL